MRHKVINPKEEVEWIVNKIKDYFVLNGNENTKAIIGISGGKDSTIAAALLVRALGPERVVGVLMPEYEQDDIKDSYKVCETLGIKHYVIDIGPACSELYNEVDSVINGASENKSITTNTPARIRMTTLYMVAAAIGGRVINTGNASELFVGYTTKYGDLAGDFAIFRNYYVREILAIGDALEELPAELVHKIPGDGMSGKTDEDNMGFSYETLDAYLLDGIYPDYLTMRNIRERHERNLHKKDINITSIHPHTRHYKDDDIIEENIFEEF